MELKNGGVTSVLPRLNKGLVNVSPSSAAGAEKAMAIGLFKSPIFAPWWSIEKSARGV